MINIPYFYQLCSTNPKADFSFIKTSKVDKLPERLIKERQRETEKEREGRRESIVVLVWVIKDS